MGNFFSSCKKKMDTDGDGTLTFDEIFDTTERAFALVGKLSGFTQEYIIALNAVHVNTGDALDVLKQIDDTLAIGSNAVLFAKHLDPKTIGDANGDGAKNALVVVTYMEAAQKVCDELVAKGVKAGEIALLKINIEAAATLLKAYAAAEQAHAEQPLAAP